MKGAARGMVLACLGFAGCAQPGGSVDAPAPLPAQPAAATPAPEPMPASFGLAGSLMQGGLAIGKTPRGTSSLTLDGKPVPFSADGQFVVGFDRDQAATSTLVATLSDGRTLTEQLRIAPRTWQIEHVNVAQRPTQSTEEYLRMRQRELARIAAARAVNVQSEGWRQRFVWPVKGRISGVFGSQRVYRGEPGAYHSGLDIAPGAGAPVVAPADGVVVLAGPPMFSLEGNLVIIDHGMGLNSAFLHLASSHVREGERVKQGQLIGTVGATGRATGPHLHWGMKWQDARIDPQPLVSGVP